MMRERTSNIIPPQTTKARIPVCRQPVSFVVRDILSKMLAQSTGFQFSIPSQKGEMGDFWATFVFFLSSSLDLPRRVSWSLANFAFARRCWGVWACTVLGQLTMYCAAWYRRCSRRSGVMSSMRLNAPLVECRLPRQEVLTIV